MMAPLRLLRGGYALAAVLAAQEAPAATGALQVRTKGGEWVAADSEAETDAKSTGIFRCDSSPGFL